jgi:hypothetical protein
MEEKAIYSSILQDFAHPLLSSDDSDELFMSKMKFIEIIWNYSIAIKFKLPLYKALEKTINEICRVDLESRLLLNRFLDIKKMNMHNTIIISQK